MANNCKLPWFWVPNSILKSESHVAHTSRNIKGDTSAQYWKAVLNVVL